VSSLYSPLLELALVEQFLLLQINGNPFRSVGTLFSEIGGKEKSALKRHYYPLEEGWWKIAKQKIGPPRHLGLFSSNFRRKTKLSSSVLSLQEKRHPLKLSR